MITFCSRLEQSVSDPRVSLGGITFLYALAVLSQMGRENSVWNASPVGCRRVGRFE